MPKYTPEGLTPNELKLREELMKEATEVKDCFTRYSFQAIALSTAILGIRAGSTDNPLISVASYFFIISLLMMVARIGIHKYTTANRNYGYILHLNRILHFEDKPDGWQHWMRQIGWEEAMRAWRIVQVGLFDRVYHTPNNNWFSRRKRLNRVAILKHLYPKNYAYQSDAILKSDDGPKTEGGYNWYLPARLVEAKCDSLPNLEGGHSIHYHAGSYLHTMLTIIHFLAVLVFCLLLRILMQEWFDLQFWKTIWAGNDLMVLGIVGCKICFIIGVSVFLFGKILWIHPRRIKILEEGLLSIHSCAVVWQAVIVAHFRALQSQKKNGVDQYFRGSTGALAEQAHGLVKDYKSVHNWIDGNLTK